MGPTSLTPSPTAREHLLEFLQFCRFHQVHIAAARQATVLDPLNPHIRTHLVWALLSGHRYMEALADAIPR